MKKTPKILLIVFLFVFAIGATFLITFREAGKLYAAAGGAASVEGQKADEVSSYLKKYFIDDYDDEKLADAAASAMVTATGDRWSYYLSADEYQDYQDNLNNAYVGIGVTITESKDDGGMKIESVTAGSPAEDSGIEAGDILTKVNGKATLELGMTGTKDEVRGEAGTTVDLTLERDGKEYSVTVTRKSIQTVVASCEMLSGKIGYIKINNFDSRCSEETIACIKKMTDAGAKSLLFDVRFNPGGLKDELVKVLDYLLPEGILFQSVDYAGEKNIDYSDASCVKLPMAVLVNQDSYSAAEFFAAALQEYGAATIVGSKTVGKGNFQTGFQLSDGSLLNISIGKYYTPKGKSLTDVGVAPDTELDLSDEDYENLYYGRLSRADDTQLQAAIKELK